MLSKLSFCLKAISKNEQPNENDFYHLKYDIAKRPSLEKGVSLKDPLIKKITMFKDKPKIELSPDIDSSDELSSNSDDFSDIDAP